MNINYTITLIRDALTRVNQKVNLIGFVRELSFPRKSNGTDYVSILKIVDESYWHDELSVHIFTDKLEDLPQVRSYRDFIVLYKVKIIEFDGRLFAVFNKKFSSFALFDEKSSINFNPYQASPGFFLLGPDKGFVTRMRIFCVHFPFTGETSEYLLSLKDITTDKYFDLVCKVLHVEEVTSDVWMLFVWDGNDTPPLSLDTNLNNEEQQPLPLQIEPFPLPRHILCQFPCVGTVIRVMASQVHEKLGLNFKGIGNWVRIRNMTGNVQFGLWNGLLTSSSRVRLLSNNDRNVLECKRNINQRGVGKEGRLPSWSSHPYCLTVVDDENVLPFATLMDLLTHPEVNVMVKCVVRVVAVCPPQPKDFCPSVGLGSGEYRMRLTLEDPTARIHALIRGDDWVKFFEGCFSIDVLTTKMNKLLGVPESCNDKENNDSLRSPPWIQCCIKSNVSREYYICGTRLAA